MQRSKASALPVLDVTVGTMLPVYDPAVVPVGTLTRYVSVVPLVVTVRGSVLGGRTDNQLAGIVVPPAPHVWPPPLFLFVTRSGFVSSGSLPPPLFV
jgi:hypothetical protein